MKPSTLAPLLAALPLALALQPRADKLAFQPADGTQVARTYELALSFTLGDVSMEVNGQDMSDAMGDFPDLSAQLAMGVTDLFVRSRENRPLELIRTYDSMESEWEAGDESGDGGELTELEGKRVRFVWDEDAEDYEVAFHESEGDAELLQGLSPDMDLLALLPPREVSPGDTWTVDSRKVLSVLLFGADLDDLDTGGDDPMAQRVQAALEPQIERLLEETALVCEYKGRREEGGATLGVVGLQLSGDGSLLLADLIEEVASEGIPPEVEVDFDISQAEVVVGITGQGELTWNVKSGHLHTYDLRSDLRVQFLLEASVDAQGQSQDISVDLSLDGEGTWRVRPR